MSFRTLWRQTVRWAVLAAAGTATAWAAPLERDLGEGLRLLRLRELPDDLPAGSAPGDAGLADG